MTPELRRARTTDGVDIAWTSVGDGPPLVHMPGVPFSNLAAEWRSPALASAYAALAGRVRLIQYDGRGTGHSRRDVTDLTLDAMVRDLEAVLDAAGLTDAPVALLGFYHSVTAAIAFAARHPERVQRLILFGGAARGWMPMSGPDTQALLTLIERDWNAFVESIAHAWLGWDVSADEGRLAAEWFRTASSPAVARATLEEAALIDVTTLLEEVRAPTLVLHRRDARVIGLPMSRELASSIPGAELRILEGSSASLFYEDADRLVDLIASFVDGRPTARHRPTTQMPPPTDTDAPDAAEPSPQPRVAGLSRREVEVLRLIAAGETNAEIGRRLGVSINTVERHAANLYRKIDARGRADAATFAVRNGLV